MWLVGLSDAAWCRTRAGSAQRTPPGSACAQPAGWTNPSRRSMPTSSRGVYKPCSRRPRPRPVRAPPCRPPGCWAPAGRRPGRGPAHLRAVLPRVPAFHHHRRAGDRTLPRWPRCCSSCTCARVARPWLLASGAAFGLAVATKVPAILMAAPAGGVGAAAVECGVWPGLRAARPSPAGTGAGGVGGRGRRRGDRHLAGVVGAATGHASANSSPTSGWETYPQRVPVGRSGMGLRARACWPGASRHCCTWARSSPAVALSWARLAAAAGTPRGARCAGRSGAGHPRPPPPGR